MKDKKVLEIWDAKGVFVQYLLKKEVRYITQIIQNRGPVTVKLVTLPESMYKAVFG